ncbi:MAG: dUTP diphosphatase [Patescibacteria group bacterium]|nr:dUTP diphosphatase [Patescibacteria group bacterium]MDE2015000.1 dUTP diphosphatase [Patescibacteria group bacterium]MDE2226428.1 dUTP diphosphatase [Patescibacteria group bacterium]
MRVKIKRFDKNIPLPEHKTSGAAAFDLTAREDVEIPPKEIRLVPLNVAMEAPAEHFILLAARSSAHKKGLMMVNGVGIVDPDYCGDDDEFKSAYYNFTDKPVRVEKGERLTQGMFIKFAKADWEEVEKMPGKTRGGFGSTGDK